MKTGPKVWADGRGRWVALLVAAGGARMGLGVALGHLVARCLRPAGEAGSVVAAVAVAAGVGLAAYGVRVGEGVLAEALGQAYLRAIRGRLLERALGGWGSGAVVGRLSGDLGVVRGWVSKGFARMCSGAVVLPGVLVALAFWQPGVAVAGVVASFLVVAMGTGLARRLGVWERESRRRRGWLAARLMERWSGSLAVRALGSEAREVRAMGRLGRVLAGWQVRRAWPAAALRHLAEVWTALVLVGWMLSAGVANADANLNANPVHPGHGHPALGAILVLLGLGASAVRDFGMAAEQWVICREAWRRLGAGLRRGRRRTVRPEEGSTESGSGPVADSVPGSLGRREVLRLEGVGFNGVVEGVDLVLARGDRVQLSGDSGSGKTLLLRLMAGQVAPTVGRVLWEGQSPEAFRGRRRARRVQWVSDAVPLFEGTVRWNLGYGVDHMEPGRLKQVARWCGLDGVSGELEAGLETRLSPRAGRLSSGLRARLLLARAAVVRPRVLLVDDPIFLVDARCSVALAEVARGLRAALVVAVSGTLRWPGATRVWRIDPRRRVVEEPGLEGLPEGLGRPGLGPRRRWAGGGIPAGAGVVANSGLR